MGYADIEDCCQDQVTDYRSCLVGRSTGSCGHELPRSIVTFRKAPSWRSNCVTPSYVEIAFRPMCLDQQGGVRYLGKCNHATGDNTTDDSLIESISVNSRTPSQNSYFDFQNIPSISTAMPLNQKKFASSTIDKFLGHEQFMNSRSSPSYNESNDEISRNIIALDLSSARMSLKRALKESIQVNCSGESRIPSQHKERSSNMNDLGSCVSARRKNVLCLRRPSSESASWHSGYSRNKRNQDFHLFRISLGKDFDWVQDSQQNVPSFCNNVSELEGVIEEEITSESDMHESVHQECQTQTAGGGYLQQVVDLASRFFLGWKTEEGHIEDPSVSHGDSSLTVEKSSNLSCFTNQEANSDTEETSESNTHNTCSERQSWQPDHHFSDSVDAQKESVQLPAGKTNVFQLLKQQFGGWTMSRKVARKKHPHLKEIGTGTRTGLKRQLELASLVQNAAEPYLKELEESSGRYNNDTYGIEKQEDMGHIKTGEFVSLVSQISHNGILAEQDGSECKEDTVEIEGIGNKFETGERMDRGEKTLQRLNERGSRSSRTDRKDNTRKQKHWYLRRRKLRRKMLGSSDGMRYVLTDGVRGQRVQESHGWAETVANEKEVTEDKESVEDEDEEEEEEEKEEDEEEDDDDEEDAAEEKEEELEQQQLQLQLQQHDKQRLNKEDTSSYILSQNAIESYDRPRMHETNVKKWRENLTAWRYRRQELSSPHFPQVGYNRQITTARISGKGPRDNNTTSIKPGQAKLGIESKDIAEAENSAEKNTRNLARTESERIGQKIPIASEGKKMKHGEQRSLCIEDGTENVDDRKHTVRFDKNQDYYSNDATWKNLASEVKGIQSSLIRLKPQRGECKGSAVLLNEKEENDRNILSDTLGRFHIARKSFFVNYEMDIKDKWIERTSDRWIQEKYRSSDEDHKMLTAGQMATDDNTEEKENMLKEVFKRMDDIASGDNSSNKNQGTVSLDKWFLLLEALTKVNEKVGDDAKMKGEKVCGDAKVKGEKVCGDAKVKGEKVCGDAKVKGEKVCEDAKVKAEKTMITNIASQSSGKLQRGDSLQTGDNLQRGDNLHKARGDIPELRKSRDCNLNKEILNWMEESNVPDVNKGGDRKHYKKTAKEMKQIERKNMNAQQSKAGLEGRRSETRSSSAETGVSNALVKIRSCGEMVEMFRNDSEKRLSQKDMFMNKVVMEEDGQHHEGIKNREQNGNNDSGTEQENCAALKSVPHREASGTLACLSNSGQKDNQLEYGSRKLEYRSVNRKETPCKEMKKGDKNVKINSRVKKAKKDQSDSDYTKNEKPCLVYKKDTNRQRSRSADTLNLAPFSKESERNSVCKRDNEILMKRDVEKINLIHKVLNENNDIQTKENNAGVSQVEIVKEGMSLKNTEVQEKGPDLLESEKTRMDIWVSSEAGDNRSIDTYETESYLGDSADNTHGKDPDVPTDVSVLDETGQLMESTVDVSEVQPGHLMEAIVGVSKEQPDQLVESTVDISEVHPDHLVESAVDISEVPPDHLVESAVDISEIHPDQIVESKVNISEVHPDQIAEPSENISRKQLVESTVGIYEETPSLEKKDDKAVIIPFSEGIIDSTHASFLKQRIIEEFEKFSARNIRPIVQVPEIRAVFEPPQAKPLFVSRKTLDKIDEFLGLKVSSWLIPEGANISEECSSSDNSEPLQVKIPDPPKPPTQPQQPDKPVKEANYDASAESAKFPEDDQLIENNRELTFYQPLLPIPADYTCTCFDCCRQFRTGKRQCRRTRSRRTLLSSDNLKCKVMRNRIHSGTRSNQDAWANSELIRSSCIKPNKRIYSNRFYKKKFSMKNILKLCPEKLDCKQAEVMPAKASEGARECSEHERLCLAMCLNAGDFNKSPKATSQYTPPIPSRQRGSHGVPHDLVTTIEYTHPRTSTPYYGFDSHTHDFEPSCLSDSSYKSDSFHSHKYNSCRTSDCTIENDWAYARISPYISPLSYLPGVCGRSYHTYSVGSSFSPRLVNNLYSSPKYLSTGIYPVYRPPLFRQSYTDYLSENCYCHRKPSIACHDCRSCPVSISSESCYSSPLLTTWSYKYPSSSWSYAASSRYPYTTREFSPRRHISANHCSGCRVPPTTSFRNCAGRLSFSIHDYV